MQHKAGVCALVAAAVLGVSGAAYALPETGVLRPGESLAGVRVGMTKARVLDVWGARHGICRDCDRTTWYFNLRPFAPEGAGVVFRRGRVVHAFTVWQPDGWRTAHGVVLGDPEAEVAAAYPGLERVACTGYDALLARGDRATTAFYVLDGELWGFGLMRPRAAPCL